MKYILLLLFSFSIFNSSNAQERKLIYDVIRNGKIIGEINFVELTQGQKKFLSMNSNVETNVIIPIKDHTAETAGFDKGVMVYSSFFQKQTGSDEVNKTIKLSGKSYKITSNGESKLIRSSQAIFKKWWTYKRSLKINSGYYFLMKSIMTTRIKMACAY